MPLTEDLAVLALADGMGGGQVGDQASSLALQELDRELRRDMIGGALLRPSILNGIERANRAVRELASGAASTLAVCEVHGHTIRPYHVGDSTILVVGQRGRIKLQTVPHSPVGYAVEAGYLDESSAMHHEDRHLVLNVLGNEDMRIEVGSILQLAPRDTVLLASDGLVDNLDRDEIISRIRKGPLGEAARVLAEDAWQRMVEPTDGAPSKADDLTFALYRRQT
jgi:serine/threonine protein phosphatase PrpC